MASRVALVIGGNGILGKSLVKKLILNNVHTISLDYQINTDASSNIIIKKSLNNEKDAIYRDIVHISNTSQLDGVFCVAGGWNGNAIGDANYTDVTNEMYRMNVEPALFACHIGDTLLSPSNGLVTLIGSYPCLLDNANNVSTMHDTSFMIGYSLAKASVHHLVKSLGKSFDSNKKTNHRYLSSDYRHPQQSSSDEGR